MYILKYYPNIKVAGLCNVPIGMKKAVIEVLKAEEKDVEMIFGGLNHFVWGRKVLYDTENIPVNLRYGKPWIEEQILDLGMIPYPYHKYYYLTDEMLNDKLIEYRSGKGTRGEQVKKVEDDLFELYKDHNLNVKSKQLEKRGG